MKKLLFLGVLILIVTLSFFCNTAETQDINFVKEYMGGELYKAGKINVLKLNGTYRQMGRQYGALLKDEISEFYDFAINERFIKKEGIPYEEIEAFAMPAFDLYPYRFQEIMRGMAETSGLSLKKIIILEEILGLTFLKSEEGSACSAIACWEDFTGGNSLVLGRNYDSVEFFQEFSPYMTVVVYKPVEAIPVAALCYSGQITSFTCMSKPGLFFENNEGMKSGGNIVYDDRLIFFASELSFLMDYSDMDNFDKAMKSARTNYAFIVTAADKNAAYVYEVPTFGIMRRSGDTPGLIVATNHFVNPDWGIMPPIPDADDKTVGRRNNLLALGKKHKGRIDAAVMMKIMDTPFDKGGATWPNRTAYQVIAIPEKLKLWIKLPKYQDWTDIDLRELFD